MTQRPVSLSRRRLGQLLLALPAVSLAASEAEPASNAAECIAARHPALSADERQRLAKSVAEAEKSLAVVRDFKLPADATPALRFRALRSKRS